MRAQLSQFETLVLLSLPKVFVSHSTLEIKADRLNVLHGGRGHLKDVVVFFGDFTKLWELRHVIAVFRHLLDWTTGLSYLF